MEMRLQELCYPLLFLTECWVRPFHDDVCSQTVCRTGSRLSRILALDVCLSEGMNVSLGEAGAYANGKTNANAKTNAKRLLSLSFFFTLQ